MINYDEFSKVELKVATILEAERVEGSEKLIKLQLELGEQKRQIVAGIGKNYEPEDLINKQIVIVANLEPRKLMGQESQGMLLAASADDHSQIVLLTPMEKISSGSSVG